MKFLILSLFTILLFQECKQVANSNREPVAHALPELIVYCENGVLAPVLEISKYFEQKYNCKVIIHNDCSKNLIGLINYSRTGDLFIPDSYQAIERLLRINPRLITDSLYIGTNKLVFIVNKGNPGRFNSSLLSLADPVHAVILANPETSSLGYETKTLLQDNSLYIPVMSNVMALSVDSRGLTRSVVNGEATVAIDWLSSYYTNESRNLVDTMNIKVDYQLPRVFATVLGSTKTPGLSHSFLATISSPRGVSIFAKHGIYKRRATFFNQIVNFYPN